VRGDDNANRRVAPDDRRRDLLIPAAASPRREPVRRLTIGRAHEFQDGAKIVGPGVGGTGGAVRLTASEAVVMAVNSRIDVTGVAGGDIDIDASAVSR
jgi:hypothetical protein